MRMRLLPLSVVLCAGTTLAGCEEILGALCDFETDDTCEDPSRAQITGVISIPEAGDESTTKKTMSPDFRALRSAVAKAAREQKGERAVAVGKRSRVPGRGRGNDFEIEKYPVEKFRPGEVIVRAKEPIRGRKAEISRELSIWLHDDVIA